MCGKKAQPRNGGAHWAKGKTAFTLKPYSSVNATMRGGPHTGTVALVGTPKKMALVLISHNSVSSCVSLANPKLAQNSS